MLWGLVMDFENKKLFKVCQILLHVRGWGLRMTLGYRLLTGSRLVYYKEWGYLVTCIHMLQRVGLTSLTPHSFYLEKVVSSLTNACM